VLKLEHFFVLEGAERPGLDAQVAARVQPMEVLL
jgi:hypothetical protein